MGPVSARNSSMKVPHYNEVYKAFFKKQNVSTPVEMHRALDIFYNMHT